MFNDQQVDPMSLACVEWLRAHEAFNQHTGKGVLERFERADRALLAALALNWIGDTDRLYHAYRSLRDSLERDHNYRLVDLLQYSQL